jgi:hypothetical protein
MFPVNFITSTIVHKRTKRPQRYIIVNYLTYSRLLCRKAEHAHHSHVVEYTKHHIVPVG